MKFLVCYDSSAASKKVLNIALQEAETFHAVILIVTALEQSESLTKEEIDRTEVRLENLCTDLNTEQQKVEPHVLVSLASPGEGLVQFAKENDVDKIFIGIEKQSKVGKLVFGSTAQYVILKAPCTVVTSR